MDNSQKQIYMTGIIMNNKTAFYAQLLISTRF